MSDVFLLMYIRYFTPNNDGFHDTWRIEFSKNEPNMEIQIFDRHGKLLKQIGPKDLGWDGTYMGQPMPSDDYWFLIKRSRGDYTGHFSLKR